MTRSLRRSLFWAPRVLAILFAIFLSVFALDVFGEGYGFWATILALLIHLIPTFLILVALAIAWRWEWVGGILFPGLGAWYLIMTWGKAIWAAAAVISGPLFLIGALFLVNWSFRAQLRATP